MTAYEKQNGPGQQAAAASAEDDNQDDENNEDTHQSDSSSSDDDDDPVPLTYEPFAIWIRAPGRLNNKQLEFVLSQAWAGTLDTVMLDRKKASRINSLLSPTVKELWHPLALFLYFGEPVPSSLTALATLATAMRKTFAPAVGLADGDGDKRKSRHGSRARDCGPVSFHSLYREIVRRRDLETNSQRQPRSKGPVPSRDIRNRHIEAAVQACMRPPPPLSLSPSISISLLVVSLAALVLLPSALLTSLPSPFSLSERHIANTDIRQTHNNLA